MLRALRLNVGRARLSPFSTNTSSFRRWLHVLYVVIPLVLVLNYLVIFQWTYFSELSKQIWPDASFHPVPHGYGHTTNPWHNANDGADYWLWNTKTRFRTHKNTPLYNLSSEDANDDCANFPRHMLKDIQVTLKVGKADNEDRTNAQLSSVIKCIPNVLIASDQSHAYGSNLKSTNVLASLPPETYLKEEDLEIYNHQKDTKNEDLHQGADGWKLDKYKFLAEVEEAVKKNSKAEWYVFFESDTYIFWDNMFRLLDGYDWNLPYYFGSPSPGRTIPSSEQNLEEKKLWFGYGGTGFVLSATAAHRLVDRRRNFLGIKGPRVTEEYKEDVQNDCCGDSMLGWALYDKAGVELSGLWPMFNPHPLHGVPLGKYYWCEPILSLHKTHPKDFQKIWDWELQWDKDKGPITYRTLLTHAQSPLHILTKFNFTRFNWDNADWDGFNEESPEHTSNQSFESCREYCAFLPDCFQFTWHGHHCWMSKALRLGQHKEPDGQHEETDRGYVSAWNSEKILEWVEESKCEDGVHWVKPSVERVF